MNVTFDALISIRPKYVKRIVSGEKKYEFRKSIFKRTVKRIFIYSSNPQKRIIGFFDWSGSIIGDVNQVWEKTCHNSGISEEEYNLYFSKSNCAYAIKLDSLHIFKYAINPWEFSGFKPPQSFFYFDERNRDLYEKLSSLV